MKLLNKTLGIIAASLVLLLVGFIIGYAVFPHNSERSNSDEISSMLDENAKTTEEDLNKKIKPLSEDTISILCCGVDKSEKLTDVIMYIVFDTKEKSVNVLRIPRDSFVGRDFPTSKINAIYGHPYENMDGAESLKKYLQDKWKLPIDYYATVTLDGLRNMIDDLGGITMNVEQTINYLPGKVLLPGEQVLDGEKSEWFIRYRAGYQNGDLGRIDAQSKFLAACIDTAKNKGRLKCLSVLQKNYKEVKTDMPLDKMITVAGNLFELDKSDLNMFVVPGKGTMYYSYSVYAVDEPGLVQMLNEHFVPAGNELTADMLEVETVSGQSTYSQGNQYNGTNNADIYSDSEDPGVASDPSVERKLYEYDENGNPLYRYDENGNPVYNYDENGNIIYIYQMENQNAETPATTDPQVEDPSGKNMIPQDKSEEGSVQNGSERQENNDTFVIKKQENRTEEKDNTKIIKKKSDNVKPSDQTE